MSNNKTPHTEAELIEIFHLGENQVKYFSRFSDYYKMCFDELLEDHKDWDDAQWVEGDSVQASALSSTKDFIQRFLELIEKGHGEAWSHAFGNSFYDGEHAIYQTHQEVKAIDKDLAQKELLIYIKSFDEDSLFESYLQTLFDDIADPDGRIEKAKQYSKIYKAQLDTGKSQIYAGVYADLMVDSDYHEIYCEDYAIAYDRAVEKNKSERYTIIYADKYASALVDIKRRYGISDDQEMMGFAVEKVNAFMHAWEYAEENKVENFEKFADIYENIHLNRYSATEGKPNLSEEEMDKLVLKKTLEKFNKYQAR